MAAPRIIGSPYSGTHTVGNWESDNAFDLAMPVGSPVYAVASGTIGPQFGLLGSKDPRFAGQRLHLNSPAGEFYYAHLSAFAPGIKPGTRVSAGQLLGYSGEANGVAHLHFAANRTNPLTFVPRTYTGGTTLIPNATGASTTSFIPTASGTSSRAGYLSYGDLQNLWIQAGGSPKLAPTMAAVALAESSGRINALNASGRDYSVGPWQINYYGNLAPSRTKRYGSAETLRNDPLANARAAVDLAAGGRGLGNWSTYSSGVYNKYLGSGGPTGGTSTVAYAAPTVVGSTSAQVGQVPTGQTVTPFATGASIYNQQPAVDVKPVVTHPANRPAYFQGSYGPKAGTKPPAAPASSSTKGTTAAAPSTFDWAALAKQALAPVDLSGLTRIAAARAAEKTNALVAGYTSLQTAALQQAAQRAAQQGQLGVAASKYLEGLDLGGRVAGDYANAAAAQRAAAAGYSGGLQQTVSDAAAEVQRNLAAAGSPQTAVNQGAAAGNVLYGLGGNLPALQLDAVGPAVAAGLRALPAQTLGYSQTLAAGQLAQGQQEAAKYNPEIVAARANEATLAADYFDKLSAAARDAGQDRIANLYKLLSLKQKDDAAVALANYRDAQLHKPQTFGSPTSGYFSIDPATGKVSQLTTGTGSAPKTFGSSTSGYFTIDPATGKVVQLTTGTGTAPKTFGSGTSGYYTIDPNTGKVIQLTTGTGSAPKTFGSAQSGYYTIGPDGKVIQLTSGTGLAPSDTAQTAPPRFNASNSNAQGFRSDQYGDPILGKNKQPVLMPGWKWGKNGMPVKMDTGSGSSTSMRVLRAQAAKLARQLSQPSGGHYTNGVLVPGSQRDPVLYPQALEQVYALFPQTPAGYAAAKRAVDSIYRMGTLGRPFTGPAGFADALTYIKKQKADGKSSAAAANAAFDEGVYSNEMIKRAILSVYPNTSTSAAGDFGGGGDFPTGG